MKPLSNKNIMQSIVQYWGISGREFLQYAHDCEAVAFRIGAITGEGPEHIMQRNSENAMSSVMTLLECLQAELENISKPPVGMERPE